MKATIFYMNLMIVTYGYMVSEQKYITENHFSYAEKFVM